MTTEKTGKVRVSMTLILILLGLPILLCGGTLSWWFGRRAIAANQLREKRAELLASGMPIDDASLTEFRDQRMSHDFSKRWMRVLETIDSKTFTDSATDIPILGVPVEEDLYQPGKPYRTADNISDFLARWSELRSEIHLITEGSGSIWTEVDFNSFQTVLPYIQSSRSVSRLLSLEYQDALGRDDREQAFHSLMALIGVARSVEDEPLLISQLVHVALASIATRELKTAIAFDLLDENQLRQILEQLKALDDFGARYRIGIAGERAAAQPVFDDPGRMGTGPNLLGSRPIDALAAIEIYSGAESVSTKDLGQFLAETQQWDAKVQRDMSQANVLRKLDTALSQMTIPAIAGFAKAIARGAMEMRIAKLAIGVRLFEKANDRWPESLDELNSLQVDLGPVRPIGSKPFGYRIVDGSAELWGLPPEGAGDMTPDEPVDPLLSEEEEREVIEFWHWRLVSDAKATASPPAAATD